MQGFMAKKLNSWFGKILSLPVLVSAFAMNMGCAAAVPGTSTVVVVPVANPQPCDLLASATPCVAAMSTTRALYSGYTGALYQVTRQSDKTTADIGLLPDGYANAATQDTFCANTTCTITKIYDQSANHNDLTPAPPGGAAKGPGPNGYDLPAVANALPVMVGGHKVYGIAICGGDGLSQQYADGDGGQGSAGGGVHGDFGAQSEHEVLL